MRYQQPQKEEDENNLRDVCKDTCQLYKEYIN